MAASRTCSYCGLLLQGLLVNINVSVIFGLTMDTDLTRQEVTTSVGKPANLGCYVNHTNPTLLTYSWTKDNLTVTQSSSIRVYGNVLVITPEKNTDFGLYECHASDGVTNMKCNISLSPGCNKTENEQTLLAHVGCANISVLMPVLAVVVVSLLLNIHFFIRWKRRDRWVFSEEEIMQMELQAAQESLPIEEITEERFEIKKKKPFFGRLRRRRGENYENDQYIEENDRNHQESACGPRDSNAREKHKEIAIEMQEIKNIPSVAEIKAADRENEEGAPARSYEARTPGISETPRFFSTTIRENDDTALALSEAAGRPDISETPRIADFFKATDEENDDRMPALSEATRRPAVSEPPRLADFFKDIDEEDDDTAPVLSEAVRRPDVSETPRLADFLNTTDTTPAVSEAVHRPAVSDPPRLADFFNDTVEENDDTAPVLSEAVRRPDISETPRIADFFNTDDTAPAVSEAARRPDISETPRIADFFNTDDTAPAVSLAARRPDITETPRIADFFNTNDTAPAVSEAARRPDVSETPRKADFINTKGKAPALSEADRRSSVSETPRIADFFLGGDDTDGEESMNSEEPLVSHYVEKMDFEGKGDSDNEPVLK